jgi:hypothetical protein
MLESRKKRNEIAEFEGSCILKYGLLRSGWMPTAALTHD